MNPTSDNPPDLPGSGILPEIGGQSPSRPAAHFLTLFPPAAAPADGLPVLPGWHLTHVLGAGGMGKVYHAIPEAGGEPAAVIIPDHRWTSNPVMVARFKSEAETLRSLDHPGIVRLLDTAETEDGRFCLLMEYVEGCDLGRLLLTEKLPLPRSPAPPPSSARSAPQSPAPTNAASSTGISNPQTSSSARTETPDWPIAASPAPPARRTEPMVD